jgi:myo-inositol-hexaphosphate 3-phosphohydrolase/sugar lactone lactonase YvrE
VSRTPASARRSAGLLAAVTVATAVLAVAPVPAWAVTPVSVAADAETVPVTSSGDSADDPAIWVNSANPSGSLVIGNDKGTALEVYDLSGARTQLISGGHGNVDVRTGFPLGSGTVDIAAAASSGIRVYRINGASRSLTNITDGGSITGASGEGFCLYHSRVSGLFYAFIITSGGRVQQVRLGDSDADGLVDGQLVRSFEVGSESEGCVADDELGLFYVSQEDVALWKYGAEPGDAPSARVQVDKVGSGGNLVSDIEGLTIVYQSNGTGYLMASAQNVADPQNSYFTVYQRQGSNAFLKAFRVVAGTGADGCSRTDGIAAVATNLGPSFPSGLFICQDDSNTTPGASGNQDFKFVRLEKIVTLESGGSDADPPDTTITSGPPSSTTATSATFAFTADEAVSGFTCRLDTGAATACSSPRSYDGLTVGDHHFEVAATDLAGNTDQTAAVWNWTITSSPPPPPPPPPPPATGIISTVAGTGTAGFSGDGGPATAARLRAPRTMAADAAGNIYIADTENHRVRRVSASGVITTIAGTGSAGYSGDGGPATSAKLNNPHGVAVDGAGNVYVADSPNHRVRRIDTSGRIATVAGTGSSGYNGDGIAATSARLNYPKGVEIGPDGLLYIADANNHRVRRISSSGIIATVAGSGSAGLSGDGGPATSAKLNTPRNVTFDASGNLYIADDNNCRVRRVDGAGRITTVAGSTCGYGGDGGPAISARLGRTRDVAVDPAGNLYIADEQNHRIRRVTPSGTMTTFAGTGTSGFSGDGGLASAARIAGPRGVAVDFSGRVLIGDTGNHRIRRVG